MRLVIKPENSPSTPEELYLDLLKRILTRALVANEFERHTIVPAGPRSRLICGLNQLAAHGNFEAVRLVKTTHEDYFESGHEAHTRAEAAETMLGLRQLDHIQQCIVNVLQEG